METLNKLIPLMVRQAHHERNQKVTVRPEPVEGLVQRIPIFMSLPGLVFLVTLLVLWPAYADSQPVETHDVLETNGFNCNFPFVPRIKML